MEKKRRERKPTGTWEQEYEEMLNRGEDQNEKAHRSKKLGANIFKNSNP